MRAILAKIKIGQTNQWISTLGNPQNEILLILHGGPGLAGMPLYNKFLKPISDKLFLVNWDQRGAGKSYSLTITKQSMNLNQLLSDAEEIVNYLRKKYSKKKIFILGHSWGSVLGILLCQKCPELIYKYFGVGQIGNWAKGELISYNYILSEATRIGNIKMMKKIFGIGKPPYNFWNLTIQRSILLKLKGAIYQDTNYNKLIKIALKSKEYKLIDAIKYGLGLRFSLRTLWKDLNKINLEEKAPELLVPICFMIGRHDYQVPFECSKKYYEIIKTPSKTWYWFEESAHNAMFEETNKFLAILYLEAST